MFDKILNIPGPELQRVLNMPECAWIGPEYA